MARVLEKSPHGIVTANEIQFGLIPERGTIDAVSILRRLQEKYYAKGKKWYMCFVNPEIPFERVPRTVLDSAMRNTRNYG